MANDVKSTDVRADVPAQKAAEQWSVRLVSGHPTSPPEWDAAVRTSGDTFLYHLSEIAPMVMPPHCTDPLSFIECRLGEKLVGGAVLELQRDRWHRLADRRTCKGLIGPLSVSPFVVDGLTGKIAEEAWDRLLEGCAEAGQELRCEEIALLDTIQSRRVLDERPVLNRYIVSTDWTGWMMWHYILDLRQDSETLWKKLETRCRTSIRRAREKVQAVSGRELEGGRDAHVALVETVFRREGRFLLDTDRLYRVWDTVYDGIQGQAVLCLNGTAPCTFTGVTRFGNTASYHHAGRGENAPNGAAALGLWTAIEWAKSVGCSWFDLNAVVPEKIGRERMHVISMFKRSFGGDIVPVHGARRRFRPLARATYDFIDAWGSQAKKCLRRLGGKGKTRSHP